MRGLVAAAVCVVAACGARSELAAPDDDASCGTTAREPYDACSPLQVTVGTAESCALANPDCAPVDLEAFQRSCGPGIDVGCDAGGAPVEAFAMTRYGHGHLAAFCDSTSLVDLLDRMPLLAYLGRVPSPRVATLGTYPCDQTYEGVPGTYLGVDLPPPYVGDAAALASDWDVLVLCANPVDYLEHTEYGSVRVEWAATLRAFVHDRGRGLLVSSDYAIEDASPPDLFEPLDAVTRPAGIVFSIANVGWSSFTVDAGCVPDWPP